MSEQPLDLRRFLQTAWRHRRLVGLAAAVGMVAGAAFAALTPAMLESKVLVVLPPNATRYIGTQLIIADSNPVLLNALHSIEPPLTLTTVRGRVHASSLTSDLISISAEGSTARQAENIANAVAASYVSYVSSPGNPGGLVPAKVLEDATAATGTPLLVRLLIDGAIGILAGLLAGAVTALALSRADRSLRERDEIANAIGVPVLASIPVGHPSDLVGWTRLLQTYEPGVVQAWNIRKVLHHLGLTDFRGNSDASLAVVSLTSDPGAIALGPQLAVFAASVGIPTDLVISPQENANVTATLSAACRAVSGRSDYLRISGEDQEDVGQPPGIALTVVVSVVDSEAPRVAGTQRATVTVLGVSAGAVTAEQLARVAVSAVGDGRDVAGIIVADPDPTDHTTGRLPQVAPPGATAAHTADWYCDGDSTVTVPRDVGGEVPGDGRADDEEFGAGAEPEGADFAVGLTSLPYISAALRRRAWLWCLAAVVGLVLGAGLNVLSPPPYQASASVLLTHNADENPVDAIQTDIAVAQSRVVAGAALRRLGIRESVASFQASYTVTMLTDRVLLITVSAPSSSAAVLRAGTVAAQFLRFRANQLQTQQNLTIAALRALIARDKVQLKSVASQITRAQAGQTGTAPALGALQARQRQTNNAMTGLEQANRQFQQSSQLATTTIIEGSRVLDPAAPTSKSRLKHDVLYAIAGLIAGLTVGLVIVIIAALVSDRLRRRDDVARALGAPVQLSVGRIKVPRRASRRLAAGRGRDAQRLSAYLGHAVPGTVRGAAALAVVPVDNASVVAVAVAALAVSCAQEGQDVIVADLCEGAPAARLLGVRSRDTGVHRVTVDDARLLVVIPDGGDIQPAGPVNPPPSRHDEQDAGPLADAYASADLLLTMADLDPAVGGEHLSTWATVAVAVITAGRSSSTRIHASGEMVRLAGIPLASAALIGADKADESLGTAPAPAAGQGPVDRQPMNAPTTALHPAGGIPWIGAKPADSRWVRRRVALAWALLVLNVLTYYPKTWSGEPLIVPIPSTIGKLITQGALPAALLVALTVNRRLIMRPNVFLFLASLLVMGAFLTVLRAEHIGTVYRTFRLTGFVATLWMLTPWWGRRDLLLIRAHLAVMSVVLGSVLLGLIVAPGHALAQGRLAGAFWPTPPTQVAEFAAVTFGLVIILWLGGLIRGRVTLFVVVFAGTVLLLTHTRTALIAMIVGVLVAGLSLITAKARARKLFATAGVVASIVAITLSSVVTTWLARGEGSQQLTDLTGRTSVWTAIVSIPRDKFQVFFGFGLSNKSFNGLPIDSNWLASYYDQGLFGVVVCATILLYLLVATYFKPRGVQRALALFLVTYCLLASFTETGFSDASTYLLYLALAASLLVPSFAGGRPT